MLWPWLVVVAMSLVMPYFILIAAAKVDSIGRRNTLATEVFGGEERLDCEDRRCAREGSSAVAGRSGAQAADALARTAFSVEGVQRQFWRLIATGVTTAEAASAVGVSVPVGMRWFRHAGGMTP